MKFDNHNENISQQRNEIEQVAKQQQEYTYFGSMVVHAGHTLFKRNRTTKKIERVKIIETAAITLDGLVEVSRKADFDKECDYVYALNIKNAEKKFNKMYKH